MILSVNSISKSFHEVPVLKDVSFHIDDYEKAAIVGINGAGKTTLLRIIMGELASDEGLVTFAKDKTVGYLSQQEAVSGENTIYQELLSVKQDILDMELTDAHSGIADENRQRRTSFTAYGQICFPDARL